MVGGNVLVSTDDRVSDQPFRGDRARAKWTDPCDCPAAADSLELTRALELVQRLDDIPIPQVEIDTARERVRARVFAAIAAQARGDATEENMGGCDAVGSIRDQPLGMSSAVLGSVRLHPRRVHAIAMRQQTSATTARARGSRRAVFGAAAMLLLGLTGLLGASHAAAATLPGAPLYGLKRGEEWLALRSAWSDTRRGEVLSQIARQRLAEAQGEAAAGNSHEVYALTAELDTTMRALISLMAQMNGQHENTGAVAAALSQTFADEHTALAQAEQQGQIVLAQSLTSAAQDQQQAMVAANLALPSTPPAPPVPAGPTSTPTSLPTPAPVGNGSPVSPAGPVRGQGSGQGVGGTGSSLSGGAPNGTGRGGNQGIGPTGQPSGGVSGVPTPTPTPMPMPAPYGPFGARRVM